MDGEIWRTELWGRVEPRVRAEVVQLTERAAKQLGFRPGSNLAQAVQQMADEFGELAAVWTLHHVCRSVMEVVDDVLAHKNTWLEFDELESVSEAAANLATDMEGDYLSGDHVPFDTRRSADHFPLDIARPAEHAELPYWPGELTGDVQQKGADYNEIQETGAMTNRGELVIQNGWYANRPRRIDAAITTKPLSIAAVARHCGFTEKEVRNHVTYWIRASLFYATTPDGLVYRTKGTQPGKAGR